MNSNAKKREQAEFLKDKKKRHEKNDLKEYEVKETNTLLNFLIANAKGHSRNSLKTILKNYCILVNGAAVTQFDFVLDVGDIVAISKIPYRSRQVGKATIDIIYEDNEFIAINKPYGVLSVASDKEKIKTAYKLVSDYIRRSDKHGKIYVVHRIDKETSGVLMFAKNENIKNIMQEKWNEIVTKRGYFAVVDGELKEKSGTIKNYLKQSNSNLTYITNDKKNSQFAITHYKLVKTNHKYSLVDVNIDTGRKNQIRVHMGSLGNFIVGDDKYGDPTDPLGRLGLHAYALHFNHPITGKQYKFETKIPQQFMSVVNS